MPLAFTTGTSSHPKNTLQKRKFEIKVLLLLHILIPGVMLSSSLETINPWLSACDLKQQDVKGSCAATTQFPASTTPLPDAELLCPKECSPNESKTNASCLAYLDETRRNAICNFNLGNGIEWLKSFLGTIRLRHCCEYKIIESLSSSLLERVLRGKDECFRIIDSLVEVDNLAARITCEFSEVLSRYDCGQPYSVKFSCNDCLEAYRRWVCSTLVPYYNESVRIRPCRSVCQAVEQKCPYFLPENKAPALPTQYAGEPTFLCMDPNIPETGEQQKKSLYPDDATCCVKICGSLKDGLCVGKGSKCRSEELTSYEEALDEAVECSPTETMGSRVPSLECTASEPYSSPHKLGSGGRRSRPWPALVLLPACLNLNLPDPLRRRSPLLLLLLLLLFLFLLLFLPLCHSSSLPSVPLSVTLLNVLVCLFAVSGDFARSRSLLLPRPRTGPAAVSQLFVKRPRLFLNNLNFGSNKWQYYFILISVNLLFSLFIKNPQPLTTPFCFIDGFAKSKKTRRARRYYYYYYFYYNYRCKHYYTILSRIAQKSNNVMSWKRYRDTNRGPFNLVAMKHCHEKKLISIKNDSLTINRIKGGSHTYKIIIIIRAKRGNSDATKRFSGSSRGRRTKGGKKEAAEASAAVAVVAPAVGLHGETFARARPRVHSPLETQIESVQKFKLDHVKTCRVSSVPKCEFQTVS